MSIVKRIFSFKSLSRIILYFWCTFSVFTFIWVISSSLKTNREFFENIWGLPTSPQFSNYIAVLTKYSLAQYFSNSLFVVIGAVAGLLVICAPASYVFARIPFKGRNAMSQLFVLGMGVPYQLMLIPLFFMMAGIGLIDTLGGLSLLYVALSIPFTIFIMLGFFKTLPHELEEAAMIDGCNPISTFFQIMLPLGKPALATAAIFNFIFLWNEFLLALTFIGHRTRFPLSVGIYSLQGSMLYTGEWTSLMAGFVVVALPTLILYMAMSRQVIEGLTMGAVKE